MIELSKGEQFVYDWQYGRLGGFKSLLAKAIAKADTGNRAKIREGFPEEVESMTNFGSKEGYWDSILDKVNQQKGE